MRSNRDLGNQGARRWRQCQTRQKAQAGSGVQLPVKLGATPVTMVEFTSSHCHQSVSAARRKYHPRSPFDAIGPIASGTPHRGDPCSCLGRSALHLKGDEGSFVDAFKRQVLSVTRVLYPVEYAAVGTPAPDESCLWPRPARNQQVSKTHRVPANLADDEAAFHSPAPTQMVSNGEFNPPPRTPQHRNVEARIMAAAFVAVNEVFRTA
jgi:hypothetical protein